MVTTGRASEEAADLLAHPLERTQCGEHWLGLWRKYSGASTPLLASLPVANNMIASVRGSAGPQDTKLSETGVACLLPTPKGG